MCEEAQTDGGKYLPGGACPALLSFAAALCLATACSTPGSSSVDGTWVGTITTEGNVTTVVNESGSVWGGAARLVEEASIGVESGPEEYMLASVASTVASEDRIYVLETRPPAVRVYDMNGHHIQDMGSEGQGPGEFQGPLMSMVRTPDGNIFVRDDYSSRMSIFSPTGELLDTWALPGGFRTAQASVATNDGTVYVPQVVGRDRDTHRPRIGMVPYDADGNAGEPPAEPQLDHESADFPPIIRPRPGGGQRTTTMRIPFMPRPLTVMSPLGAWVAGTGASYRFEIRYFDGAVTVVERRTDPVPVSGAEAAEHRRRTTARARSRDPQWAWNGPGIPDHKPFFDDLHADQSGRVWVRRRGPSTRIDKCNGIPQSQAGGEAAESGTSTRLCWKDFSYFEVFGRDGRYLGEVAFPQYFRPFGGGFGNVFIRDDMVLMEVEDDAGTIMVKRYRLVLPGEEER